VSAGARLVVIDPRRTPLAARADRHLAVRPGTDVALALAMIAVAERDGLIDHDFVASRTSGLAQLLAAARPWTPDRAGEVCGLDASEIVALTHDWSTARPAMLRIGWGQERNANGGAACRAILALPAVLGQFGARGSGVLSSLSGARPVALRRLDPEPPGGFPVRRSVPMHQLGRWLNDADEAIEVLIVQGANPLVTCPDERAVRRGLLRDDLFTVVHEQVLTDTARYADVVFPAVTHYETTDLAGSYGTFTLQPVEPVIAAVGESRTNDEFAAALAVRLGLPVSAFVVDAEAQRRAAVTDDGGLGPRLLRSSTIQFVDTSPDGPVRLVDPVVGAPRYVPLAASEPLVLLTPASARTINSMFGEFQSPDPVIRVHPVDAAARGLVGGERVAVHNSLGRIEVRCTVDGDLRPGVAVMPKGVWLDNYSGGEGVNSLITDEADELAFGACFNDARVEVTRLD
jgi:anaerobic selenocysteine-containing dehydrogenase